MTNELTSTQIDKLLEAYSRRLVEKLTVNEMKTYIQLDCIDSLQFSEEDEIFDEINLNLGANQLKELLKEINAEKVLELLNEKEDYIQIQDC
tara:strand:+ start:96 stop:371 length:276 start_codon:yes stop_codon:yes gene_type:complete